MANELLVQWTNMPAVLVECNALDPFARVRHLEAEKEAEGAAEVVGACERLQ